MTMPRVLIAEIAFAGLLVGAGSVAQANSLEPVADNGELYDGARDAVISTGRSCAEVVQMYRVGSAPIAGAVQHRVVCSNGRNYRVTLFQGRVFVKDWSDDPFE